MVPTIHQTDLFRPHEDPDDHWDLLCQFALASMGRIQLSAVLIDFPTKENREPDVIAVSQLNRIFGLSIPMVLGVAPGWSDPTIRPVCANRPSYALSALLEHASEPVSIHIVGSCHDVSELIRNNAALLQAKCGSIYLNAGTGLADPAQQRQLEYNVELAPDAYASIFDAPCPVYWLPCQLAGDDCLMSYEWASIWRFRQSEILSCLPDPLRQYFAGVLGKRCTTDWLSFLAAPPDEEALKSIGDAHRNMWCTAGFLHAAGLSVTKSGQVKPLEEIDPQNAVYTFEPINVSCGPDGRTAWTLAGKASERSIIHVLDTEAYPSAMTNALKSLILSGIEQGAQPDAFGAGLL